MENTSFITDALEDLKMQGLLRSMKDIVGTQGSRVTIDGREYLNFCSNNYLGLADDPRIRRAAVDSIEADGFGSGASRLVCGNLEAHVALEKYMAEFKGTEGCLLFSTGYMANVGILSSLFGRDDLILMDRLNHASLIDGARLSGSKFKRFAHNDMKNLEELLGINKSIVRKVIVVDSVFSMDGDIAPLDKIVALAKKYECMVMVDEAHGLGVIGKNGKGVVEYFGLADEIDIQMGTFSKAVGSFGGYCCAKNEVIDYLINKARSFIYTTGMPPSIAAASLEGMRIIKEHPELRTKLWDNMSHLTLELKGLGFDPGYAMTPIIPLIVNDTQKAVEFSTRLFEKNILVSAIRPPTVAEGTARLRITLSATHQIKEIDYLLDNLKVIGKDLGLV
ncbi:MAG: 8-amino-7-oxononanoate synthase [Lysobacterales bacterium]|jgi:8-amino-7-oxononanoate synthase